MDKVYLEELLKENSINSIAEITGKGFSTIRYWMKKYQLKSIYNQIGEKNNNKRATTYDQRVLGKKWKCESRSLKYLKDRQERAKLLPLEEINNKFQSGSQWRDICNEYNLSFAFISWLFKNHYLDKVSERRISKNRAKNQKGKKHTKETKQILAQKRKKYLAEHPEHRWHQNSKHHTSWLCETVKQQLKDMGIIFIEEYMPLREQGRYFAIDIAFPNFKAAFEINGRQHYDADGSLLPYFQNRHDLIESVGWKVHEIKYDKNYMNIVEYIIKELEIVTNNQKLK